MAPARVSNFPAHVLACWNWKCALMSAAVRSLIYAAAMARSGTAGRTAVVLVELAYVTFTAGIYAALQQRALGLRSRVMGNLIVAVGVPGAAQILDWLAHRMSGAAAPTRAYVMVCCFAGVSALFHLHVMRNGVFLSGQGHSLSEDFRRIPRLLAGFFARPFVLLAPRLRRAAAAALESDGTI